MYTYMANALWRALMLKTVVWYYDIMIMLFSMAETWMIYVYFYMFWWWRSCIAIHSSEGPHSPIYRGGMAGHLTVPIQEPHRKP